MIADHIFLAAEDHRDTLIAHLFAQEQDIFGLVSYRAGAARAEIDGSAHEFGSPVRENSGCRDRAFRALSGVDGLAVQVVFLRAVKAVADIGREGAFFACQCHRAVVVALRASQYNSVPAKICLIPTSHPDIVVGQIFPGCLPELDQVQAGALSKGNLIF